MIVGARPCLVKGVNIVGLRRKGFSAETISKLNEAMKLWMRQDVEKNQCMHEIEAQFGDVPEVARLLEFIRTSQTGVLR
jgi:UDP-N-acetylglucosamine acyltransferase